MTLGPTGGGCEPPVVVQLNTHTVRPFRRGPRLTLRAAVIFAFALLVGIGAGNLAYFASRRPAGAVLAGIAACAAAVTFLNTTIG